MKARNFLTVLSRGETHGVVVPWIKFGLLELSCCRQEVKFQGSETECGVRFELPLPRIDLGLSEQCCME